MDEPPKKPSKKPELRLITNDSIPPIRQDLPPHVGRRREAVALELGSIPTRKPTWTKKDDWYSAVCHRGRYIDHLGNGACKYRDVRISLATEGRYFLTATCREWTLHEDANSKDLLAAADWADEEDIEFCETLLFHWYGYGNPFFMGTVLHVQSIVVDNQIEPNNIAWMLLDDAIEREFKSRAAMALFQVSPVEYFSGREDQRNAFAKRRRRLMRFFEYFTGARPLPLETGIEGWMWKPIREHCPHPSISAQHRFELG